MRFQRTKCSYVAKRDKLPEMCPYCGEEKTMVVAKDAQDILDELIDN